MSTPGGHHTRSYPEVTVASIVFGVLVGAVMNAAIAYAGLKIGFTIVGSAIVAVLGFGVLRGILRRGTIVEVNLTQTIATAVNTSNAGVIFTVPALLLLGEKLEFSDPKFWWLTIAASAGAVLGVAFIVPLRKQMLDLDRLRFPSGTAVATILKSPGAGVAKSIVLAAGILVGALIYLPAALPNIRIAIPAERLDAMVAAGRITAADAQRARTIDSIIAGQPVPADVLELAERLNAAPPPADGSTVRRTAAERFAISALAVSRGEKPASELDAYRPTHPLWGYSNFDWRLAPVTEADGSTLTLDNDRDRDGTPDLILSNDRVDVGRWLGFPPQVVLVLAITPLSLGAGFLTGKAGLVVLAGGLIASIVINPLAFNNGWMPDSLAPHDAGAFGLANINRPLGIGLLLGGAMLGILFALPALREALRSMGRPRAPGVSSDELSIRGVLLIAVPAIAMLLLSAELADPAPPAGGGLLGGLPPLLSKAIIVAVCVAWIWFAGLIIAQCTGMTDWSPLSGMALLTVVLVMVLGGTGDVLAAVLMGCALCCAISLASDMMSDLKTGHLVGSVPRRQQIVEALVAGLGPVITMCTVVLIAQVNMKTFGAPLGPGTDTPAAQAVTLQTIIQGVQGGEMPYALYGFGCVLGALLGIGAFPGLGVLVGLSMFLPTAFIMVYGVGCVLNMIVAKIKGKQWAEDWGVPFCAGLIVGEAMLALSVNAVVLLKG